MAERDAKVRLNLAAAGFLTQMRALRSSAKEFEDAIGGIGTGAEKTSRKTSGFFSAMKAGASGAKGALSELGGQLKSMLSMAATLGGALSVGSAIREAQSLSASYKDLAFAIRRGTGETMTAAAVQGDVTAVADRWKRGNKEVAESYGAIFSATGNLAFTKKAIDSVAMAANASGKSTQTLSNIAGTLNEKFGIGAEGIDNALASVLELGNKGGVSVEDMGEKLGMVGASAKLLGMNGQAGLQQVLGMLNIADDATGSFKKSLAATSTLLEGLADPDKAKAIQKALGVGILDKGGAPKQDALERILAKTKGKQSELAKVFSGEELKLVVALGQKFAKTFDETKGDVKTKTAAAIEAYRAALTDAGKASFTGADMQKDANDRNNDSQRNMQAAMNKFIAAFEKPEMIKAMDQLAAATPKLAAGLAKLVEFAVNSPLLAGGALVGGVAAKGAAGAVITKVSEGAMERAGKLMGESLANTPSWGIAGKAVGASFVLAAAAGGVAIGKAIADYFLDKDEAALGAIEDASSSAESMAKHGTGTPEQRAKVAEELRKQITELDSAEPSFLSGMYGLAAPEGESFGARQGEKLRRAQDALLALERKPKAAATFFGGGGDPAHPFGVPPIGPPVAPGGVPSSDTKKLAAELANGEPRKTVITNEQALASAVARQLGATTLRVTVAGGGSGTNGLPPAPGNGSGSTPR